LNEGREGVSRNIGRKILTHPYFYKQLILIIYEQIDINVIVTTKKDSAIYKTIENPVNQNLDLEKVVEIL